MIKSYVDDDFDNYSNYIDTFVTLFISRVQTLS